MRCCILFIILLFAIACTNRSSEPTSVNISGTYALEVASSYGTTRDTIQIEAQAPREHLYFVTHKMRFVKKLNGNDTTYRFATTTHLATYEEHLGHLQDINDGTLFMLYHEEDNAPSNTAHYRKIN